MIFGTLMKKAIPGMTLRNTINLVQNTGNLPIKRFFQPEKKPLGRKYGFEKEGGIIIIFPSQANAIQKKNRLNGVYNFIKDPEIGG